MSNLMPKEEKAKGRRPDRGAGDMTEMARGRGKSGEGYVRLRLRYEQGEISIVSVKRIDGPLVQPKILGDGFVYRVKRGSRQISAETIPDLGVQRSFPPPEGEETEEVRGHHVTELKSYEFNVRIPAEEFTGSGLRYLQIALFETVETPAVRTLDARPLEVQFAKEIRLVGQLKGIRLYELPDALKKQVREALR